MTLGGLLSAGGVSAVLFVLGVFEFRDIVGLSNVAVSIV